MLVKTYAASINGIDAELITIEVNLSSGFRFSIVGLPDSAVKESQDRITYLRPLMLLHRKRWKDIL